MVDVWVCFIVNLDNFGFVVVNNQGVVDCQVLWLVFINLDLLVVLDILLWLCVCVVELGDCLFGVEQVDEDGCCDDVVCCCDLDFVVMLCNFGCGVCLVILVDLVQILQVVLVLFGVLLLMLWSLFDCFGGWDVGYCLYVEDLDLCCCVCDVGVVVVIVNDLQVIYVCGVFSCLWLFFVEWYKYCGLWCYFCKFEVLCCNLLVQGVVWIVIWVYVVVQVLCLLWV